MRSKVRIGIISTADAPDPVTLDPISAFDTIVYGADGNGIARVKFPSANEVEVDAAGQLIVKQDIELHLPSGTGGVTPDMYAVVDEDLDDPSLVGRVFRIKGRPQGGQTTAERYAVEETGETIPED